MKKLSLTLWTELRDLFSICNRRIAITLRKSLLEVIRGLWTTKGFSTRPSHGEMHSEVEYCFSNCDGYIRTFKFFGCNICIENRNTNDRR